MNIYSLIQAIDPAIAQAILLSIGTLLLYEIASLAINALIQRPIYDFDEFPRASIMIDDEALLDTAEAIWNERKSEIKDDWRDPEFAEFLFSIINEAGSPKGVRISNF